MRSTTSVGAPKGYGYKDGNLPRRRKRRVRKSGKERRSQLKENRKKKNDACGGDEERSNETPRGCVVWTDEEDGSETNRVNPRYLVLSTGLSSISSRDIRWSPPFEHSMVFRNAWERKQEEESRDASRKILQFRHTCVVRRSVTRIENEEKRDRQICELNTYFEYFTLRRSKEADEQQRWLPLSEASDAVRFPELRQLLRSAHEFIVKEYRRTYFGVGRVVDLVSLDGSSPSTFITRLSWATVYGPAEERTSVVSEQKRASETKTRKDGRPICRSFRRDGTCAYGNLCRFSHNKGPPTPTLSFHVSRTDAASKSVINCFVCGDQPKKSFSKSQLVLEKGLRRCRTCVANAKRGIYSADTTDPRNWSKENISTWMLMHTFSELQIESVTRETPHGHKFLTLSGKVLKKRIRGFRNADGGDAIVDRKRFQKLLLNLRESIGLCDLNGDARRSV